MDFRKKLCAATFFLVIIAHMLLGFTLKELTGSNEGYTYGFFLYILVPAMPFLVGLKKLNIYFLLPPTFYKLIDFPIKKTC